LRSAPSGHGWSRWGEPGSRIKGFVRGSLRSSQAIRVDPWYPW
jgi:hypothetical protein